MKELIKKWLGCTCAERKQIERDVWSEKIATISKRLCETQTQFQQEKHKYGELLDRHLKLKDTLEDIQSRLVENN